MRSDQGKAHEVGLPVEEKARVAREWAIGRMTAMLNQGQIDGIVRLALSTRIHGQRLARGDWHGVMDAAANIREIEAGLGILTAGGTQ